MKYTDLNQWHQGYGKEVMDKNEFSEFEKYLDDRSQNGSHTLDEWEDLYDDFLNNSKKSARKSIRESNRTKLDIIKDMVDLAYDVRRQFKTDKDSYFGNQPNSVINAKDDKVYEKFVDLAEKLKLHGWNQYIDYAYDLIDEYENVIEESKKSARKSIKESTINTLDDVEFELLNIAKNYGIAMEGSSKGLSFLNKEVSPNLIRKLNDKYYDEYSPYPPYLLAMKELLFEYDKGFSKFMDVYTR